MRRRWLLVARLMALGTSMADQERATLSSICANLRAILARVKLRSRAFTALNLEPSIATLASANRSRRRHTATNCAQTLPIAWPLSLRKSAIVL